MAILDCLPGVEVTISVDNHNLEALDHGNDIEEEANTITKYIKIDPDVNFGVRLKVAKWTAYKGDCLKFRICLDGEDVRRPLVPRHQTTRADFVETILGAQSKGELRKFRFSAVQITEATGQGRVKDAARVKDLGSIRVEIDHVRQGCAVPEGGSVQSMLNKSRVSEKVSKGRALSHATKLDKAEKAAKLTYSTSTYVDPERVPAATFVFQYRSLECLKQLHIVERTPEPVPLEERDPATFSSEEMLQLIAKMKEREAGLLRVKREARDDDSRLRKRQRTSGAGTQVEVDDDGRIVRESTTSTMAPAPREVIELD